MKSHLNFDKNPFLKGSSHYKNKLLEQIKELPQNKNLDVQLKIGKSQFNENQYYQGAAELTLEFWALRKKYQYKTDEIISSNSNKNIDLQVVAKKDIYLNFEVKCPNKDNYPKNSTTIDYSYRFTVKEESERIKQELNRFLKPFFENLVDMKINDNKLKDYLNSANEKFSAIPCRHNHLNILLIALPKDHLISYYLYLYNTCSGLFTNNSEPYHNVDLVILSGFMDKHHNKNCEAWDFSKGVNIACLNPKSPIFLELNGVNSLTKKIKNDISNRLNLELSHFIPLKSKAFDKLYNKRVIEENSEDILMLYEFIANYDSYKFDSPLY